MRFRKKKYLIISVILLLIALSGLIYVFEKDNPTASIHSFTDAIWYTMVTLTTVGYGDYYPITLGGRVIGLILVFCSLGLIGSIVASVIGMVNNNLIPKVRLSFMKNREWYVFTELNEKTFTLIEDIEKNEKDNIFFICQSSTVDLPESSNIVVLNVSISKIIEMKKTSLNSLHVFFMKNVENDYENFSQAYKVYQRYINDNIIPFQCFCLTQYAPDTIPVNLICFNEYENTSRLYWNQYPLAQKDEVIAMIGIGKYGSNLLERALMGNVIDVKQNVQYHIFNDDIEFLMTHPYLYNYFSDSVSESKDSIIFHEDDWRKHKQLLETADRIILCNDDSCNNLEVLSLMRKYFVLNEKVMIHVLAGEKIADAVTFGAVEDIYTSELVLQSKLNSMAIAMNEKYRQGEIQAHREAPADWNHLSEFKRQSNIAVADHIAIKVKVLDADTSNGAYKKYVTLTDEDKVWYWHLEHERWTRFHIVNNWQYAPVRNNAKRLHPLIIDFDRLSYEDKFKDSFAWETLAEE